MSPPNFQTFSLPVILAKWPWSRTLSEHYNEAKAESSAWIESFDPFTKKGLKAFHKCDFSMFCLSQTYFWFHGESNFYFYLRPSLIVSVFSP